MNLRHRGLHWLLGFVLGAVFLYASYEKIAKPADFARIIYHYQIVGPNGTLPPLAANLLAVTLPWVEVVVGVLLVTGLWRREAAGVTAILLVLFLIAVGSAMWRGIDIENCGCFSVSGSGRRAGVFLLLGDAGLLAAAWLLTFWPPRAGAGVTLQPMPGAVVSDVGLTRPAD